MKELKNDLLINIKINFMVVFTSIVYTLFKRKFVSSLHRFPQYNGDADRKNPLFRKHLMNFTLLAATFRQYLFYPYINYDIKHISRSSHREVFSWSRSKSNSLALSQLGHDAVTMLGFGCFSIATLDNVVITLSQRCISDVVTAPKN